MTARSQFLPHPLALVVDIIGFILGLAVGLSLLVYQRSRDRAKLTATLASIQKTEAAGAPFSVASNLSLAIAYQQDELQQCEEELESFRRIINTAPIGYLHVDDENRLIWANPAAQRLLNIPDGVPTPPRLLLELVRSYELDELIDQTRAADAPCCSDWVFYPVCADLNAVSQGDPCALRGGGIPLRDRHVGVFLENRQEAVTLRQQRDRWISDVAHELKTPLTSIRLVAETLHGRLSPPLQGWTERLMNETIRLSNLVQDLLDLSHLERRSPNHLTLQQVDIVALVDTAWQNLEPLARKKQLHLQYNGPAHVHLELDEARMYRVLLNLLDNSIKYSPPKAVIRVDLQRSLSEDDPEPTQTNAMPDLHDPTEIVLDIIDAGIGFPETAIAHVFERFYRADPSRTRATSFTGNGMPDEGASFSQSSHSSGSGIGLAIVQQIVNAHGGQITADNHPETGGAWLRIRLPRTQSAMMAPSSSS